MFPLAKFKEKNPSAVCTSRFLPVPPRFDMDTMASQFRTDLNDCNTSQISTQNRNKNRSVSDPEWATPVDFFIAGMWFFAYGSGE